MTTHQTPATALRTTTLPSGETVPVLGQGTWGMAEHPERRADEIKALRMGIDVGMTLIDTAEMYAGGGAEELVAAAIEGRRAEVFLVSKVLPNHATRRGTIAACEASLRRLGTDRLDLYLLHWRGDTPLDETLAAFDALVRGGKIRHWGVSNFDAADMEELEAAANGRSTTPSPTPTRLPRWGPRPAATNQVLYNPLRRGIEWALLPWCLSRRIAIMAYSPIEQGRLLRRRALQRVAKRQEATPAQVALAWVLRQEGVIAIPKASSIDHVRENRGALEVRLTNTDLDELDAAFPPPTKPTPLEML
jgi:diketogulonate reductase-like aldo/keto reductase